MLDELLEKDLLIEKETYEKVNTELHRNREEKVEEELKKYEEKFGEDYEEYKKAGYRELEKEEISKKSCWSCSYFRGGYIGAGCWCSQEICDFKENENVLISQ